MFEAARWAPSCFNMQPWRFLYARKDSEHWLRFLNLLIPYNQDWAKNASVLGVVVSKTLLERPNRDPVPSHSHSYDAGAAWMSLALQASKLGWAAHGMIGFDIPRTYLELHVPEHHRGRGGVRYREADHAPRPAGSLGRPRASERPRSRWRRSSSKAAFRRLSRRRSSRWLA